MDIKVIEAKKEIVITKAFAKEAEKFRSDEYNALREAKNDNPTFRVVVRKSPKKDSHKGLTFDFMRKYIEKNGDGNGNLMRDFETITKNGDGIQSMTYGEVREWFLTTFPEVDEIYRERAKIAQRVKEKKAELNGAA